MYDTCSFKPQPYWLTFDPTKASGTPISKELEKAAQTAQHQCVKLAESSTFIGITTQCQYIEEEDSDVSVVALRRVDEAPIVFSLQPFHTSFTPRALIFHSDVLYQDPSSKQWLQSINPEHSRLMKVRKYTPGLVDEIKFLLSQQGSLGFGFAYNHYFIDMSRCPGRNFHEWLRERELSCNAKINLTHQLLKTLCTYVCAELVHPDLKPSNMLYDEASNEITFIDFDYIKCASYFPQWYQRFDNLVSTRRFRAPEQAIEKKISYQSMVYTMGIILINLWSEKPLAAEAAYTDPEHNFSAQVNFSECFQTLRTDTPLLIPDLQKLLSAMVEYDEDCRPSAHATLIRYEKILINWQKNNDLSLSY